MWEKRHLIRICKKKTIQYVEEILNNNCVTESEDIKENFILQERR